jgi:hypothetical protein
MGDWAAFCRADKCRHYFEMYSAFESCRGGGEEAPTVKDPCCNMYGDFYTAVMEAYKWEAAESHMLFPAALVREPPDLAACRCGVPALSRRADRHIRSHRGDIRCHTPYALAEVSNGFGLECSEIPPSGLG